MEKKCDSCHENDLLSLISQDDALFHPIHGHSFENFTFKGLHRCIACTGIIWGTFSNGCRCLRCGSLVHRHCASNRSLVVCSQVLDNRDNDDARQSHEINDVSLGDVDEKKHEIKDYMRFSKEYFTRYSPYVAGGLVGAIVAGPVGFMAGSKIGAVPLVAGLSLGAARARRDTKEDSNQIDSLEWATLICKKYKPNPLKEKVVNDKMDAKSIHRFVSDLLKGTTSQDNSLFDMNAALLQCFYERVRKRSLVRKDTNHVLGNTENDAKTYVSHMIAVVLHEYPILASCEATQTACSLSVEKIIFDDIYSPVFKEFRTYCAPQDETLDQNIKAIRELDGATGILAADAFGQAIKLLQQVKTLTSPSEKLSSLTRAFISICDIHEAIEGKGANADSLLPQVCDVLVQAKVTCFTSEIGFISAFTREGGRGKEGYTLTTFQAALHIISTVDTTQKSIPKSIPSNTETKKYSIPLETEVVEDDVFYDAQSEWTTPSSPLPGRNPKSSFTFFSRLTADDLRSRLLEVCGEEEFFPNPLQDELKAINQDKKCTYGMDLMNSPPPSSTPNNTT